MSAVRRERCSTNLVSFRLLKVCFNFSGILGAGREQGGEGDERGGGRWGGTKERKGGRGGGGGRECVFGKGEERG